MTRLGVVDDWQPEVPATLDERDDEESSEELDEDDFRQFADLDDDED